MVPGPRLLVGRGVLARLLPEAHTWRPTGVAGPDAGGGGHQAGGGRGRGVAGSTRNSCASVFASNTRTRIPTSQGVCEV